jgi:hypothetical protein
VKSDTRNIHRRGVVGQTDRLAKALNQPSGYRLSRSVQTTEEIPAAMRQAVQPRLSFSLCFSPFHVSICWNENARMNIRRYEYQQDRNDRWECRFLNAEGKYQRRRTATFWRRKGIIEALWGSTIRLGCAHASGADCLPFQGRSTPGVRRFLDRLS